MYYYELPKFAELVSNGEINLSSAIPLKSMDHNMIHNISFLDHCNHLCQKNKTNLLRLLSVILQKLNGDMILRVNRYPQLNSKIQTAIGEWSESIEPLDLFRCPNSCYDSENVFRLQDSVSGYDSEFSRLNENLKENDDNSDLYEVLEKLKNNYHECDGELRDNLIQLEERTNEYDPPYRKILDDLSTRPKSFYMDNLLSGDNGGNINNINNNVNMRLVKGIPENIPVIFLNSALLSTLISKCMEGHKSECMKLKEILSKKNEDIEDIMNRIGPGVPLSDSIMNFISGVKGFFDENDSDLPSDDSDNEDDEDKIANVLNKLIKPEQMETMVPIEDNNSEIDEGDMYHLKILKENSDNADAATAAADADADAAAATAAADADADAATAAADADADAATADADQISFYD